MPTKRPVSAGAARRAALERKRLGLSKLSGLALQNYINFLKSHSGRAKLRQLVSETLYWLEKKEFPPQRFWRKIHKASPRTIRTLAGQLTESKLPQFDEYTQNAIALRVREMVLKRLQGMRAEGAVVERREKQLKRKAVERKPPGVKGMVSFGELVKAMRQMGIGRVYYRKIRREVKIAPKRIMVEGRARKRALVFLTKSDAQKFLRTARKMLREGKLKTGRQ